MKAKFWAFLKDYEWPIVWLVAVTALILGIIGFRKTFGPAKSQWDIFYLALQLFTLEVRSFAGSISRSTTEHCQISGAGGNS